MNSIDTRWRSVLRCRRIPTIWSSSFSPSVKDLWKKTRPAHLLSEVAKLYSIPVTPFLLASSSIKSYSFIVLRSIKKKLTLERSKTFCRKVKTVLRLEGISFLISASVRMFRKPKRRLEFNFPLNRAPAMILFSIVLPSKSSATPILREKKGMTSLLAPKSLKRSSFCVKNCRFSGSEIAKRVRFTT